MGMLVVSASINVVPASILTQGGQQNGGHITEDIF